MSGGVPARTQQSLGNDANAMAFNLRQLAGNRILKHAALLVSGTMLAQLVLIGTQLVIRRLYGAEDFGAFSLYMSVVNVLTVLCTLRYELAVVLPRSERKATALVLGGIAIVVAVNALATLAILIFPETVTRWLSFPAAHTRWLFLIPISAAFFSGYQFLNFWLTRRSAFRAISANKVLRRAVEGTAQSAFGALGKTWGLPLGDVVGNGINFAAGCLQGTLHGFALKGQTARGVWRVLGEYRQFPQYQALPSVLNTLSLLMPVFFLNAFFGPAPTGYFDLSRQILVVPIAFVTASLTQVLLKELRDKVVSRQEVTPTVLRSAAALTALIAPFALVMVFWGPQLFALVFSTNWAPSGEYARILAAAFAIRFVVSPLSISFTVIQKLKTQAVWQFGYFLLMLSLWFFADLSVERFLLLYVGFVIVAYLAYFALIIASCHRFDWGRKPIDAPTKAPGNRP